MAANEECRPRSYQKHQQIEEIEHKLYSGDANVVSARAFVCAVDAGLALWWTSQRRLAVGIFLLKLWKVSQVV
jgi:hypothetical protein